MKTNCRQIEQQIQNYLDRELNETQQQELLAHLDRCDACRASYAPLLEAIGDLEGELPATVPAGLLQKVLDELPAALAAPSDRPMQLAARPRRSRLLPWFTGIAAAAAILLILVSRFQSVSRQPTRALDSESTSASLDPQAMLCLASAACIAPAGNTQSSLALAAGQLAAWRWRQAASEPVRITVCMAVPRESQDARSFLALPESDLIQMISNRAALHSGM